MHSSKAYERGNPVRHRDVRLVLRECIRIIVELNWFFIIPKHRIQEGRCKKENSEYALVLLQKKKKRRDMLQPLSQRVERTLSKAMVSLTKGTKALDVLQVISHVIVRQ